MDQARVNQIARWARIFLAPGQVCECRGLHVPRQVEGGTSVRKAVTTFHDSAESLARQAVELDNSNAKGVYFTINPLRPEMLTSKASCRKEDVLARHWLPIDCDPQRPADTSSTEGERHASWQVLDRCRTVLEDAGMAGAVVADSGNGFHLCYPIRLPNDDQAQAVVKSTLAGLNARCGDDRAQVDLKTHDAPRIWTVYGTRKRKGDPSQERPHRYTQVIEGRPPTEEQAQANTEALRRLLSLWRRQEDLTAGRPANEATGEQRYAQTVLLRECSAVRSAGVGGRNDQLNKSAFALGQLVAAHALSRPEVESSLLAAALEAGLSQGEASRTIRSGLESGLEQPRDLSSVRNKADQHRQNGQSQRERPEDREEEPRPSADNSDDPLDQDATAADLIAANVSIRWVWPNWIPLGVLTILASEPGCGKTRLCCDLARRLALGLPWPDGTAQTYPPGTATLWVPADNQHPELGTIPEAFGFAPSLVYLNATRRNLYSGTQLDTKEELRDFEARIARIKPGIVFVDTCLNATERASHKPEDAKAFFVPLQQIAARQQVAMVMVTHLNKGGTPLGRRIVGQGRVVIQLDKPDPDNQPNRRKLVVVKSNSLFPPGLGVTMGDAGNDYDLSPPEAPAGEKASPVDPKVAEWLSEQLKNGGKRVSNLRREAEAEGISSGTLYRAMKYMGVEEYTADGYKFWHIPTPELPETWSES